jgi:hypothetical protein
VLGGPYSVLILAFELICVDPVEHTCDYSAVWVACSARFCNGDQWMFWLRR